MKIQKITSQSRRDFTAVMECEHCGTTEMNNSGYDDAFYHAKVIPSMKCKQCEKTSGDDYRPLTTKYGEHEVA
jgi:primosomal protein N'